MKRNNKTNRMVAFLAAVILTVFGLCQAAFAADTNTNRNASINPEEPVSLTISLLKENNEVAADKIATIELYQVGQWDSSAGKYVLTDDFAESGANLEGEKGEDILKEIEILSTYAKENSLSPLVTGKTKNGQYTFSNLAMGLYMVTSLDAELAKAEGDNSAITPFLTTLPIWVGQDAAEDGQWQYNVTASPKHSDLENGNGGNNGGNSGGSSGGSGGSGGGGGGSRGGRDTTTITPGGTPTAQIDDEGTPLDNLDPPLENIDDEDVPLDNPFTKLIEDVLVPLGLLPKTGDGSISYAPLLALMAASGLLIFGLIWRRVRKSNV